MIYRKQLTELDFYKQDLECKLQKEIKEMEQVCKEKTMQYIRGWLSNYDSGHFDRIEHFYKKFNFDVKFNENRTTGNIYLKL